MHARSIGLFVIALLVLYAVAAPPAKLSTDFGHVVPRPGSSAVVQGRVLNSGGGGLRGAEIVINILSGLKYGSAA